MSKVLVDSGIKWIGFLPNTWSITTVNKLFYRRKEINDSKDPTILSLARDGVKIRDISTNEGQLAESYDNYHKVYKGDLLINPMDLISGANCSLSKVEGVISPAYINLANKTKIYSKYYDYFFKYQYWIKAMFIHGKGVSFDNRWTMNWETMSNYKVPYPKYDEQRKIADYLDQKCLKIDDIIKDNNKEIELLNEYKHSIILDFVTKGIKKEKFIDSNVDWIGKIPYNWQIKKGKYIFDLPLNSYNNHIYEKEVNLVRVEHLNSTIGEFRIKEEFDRIKVNKEAEMIKPPMILTPKRGGAIYTNKVKIINTPCVLDPNVMALKTNENLKFYAYVLSGRKLSNLADISTIPQLNNKHIYNVYFPVPPRIEEEQIVSLLDKKVNIINKVIEYRKQIIEKLEEYKKSLIYECVTGKREV